MYDKEYCSLENKQSIKDMNGVVYIYKYSYPTVISDEITICSFYVCSVCHDNGDFSKTYEESKSCKKHVLEKISRVKLFDFSIE